MSKVYEVHRGLVAAVNDARTREQHAVSYAFLHAWRAGVACALDWGSADQGRMLMDADWLYIEQDVERPMCGGVWLDWEPA